MSAQPHPPIEVAAAEAEKTFPAILRSVREGERYVVLMEGRPVAEIRPIEPPAAETDPAEAERKRVTAAFDRVDELARGNRLGPDLTIQQLREDASLAPAEAMARFRELAKENRLGPDLTIQQLREEGRRY